MSTSALPSNWIPRWSNFSILLASSGLLALTLAIHPLWNAAILKASKDGLDASQGWFNIAFTGGNILIWVIGLAVAVGSAIAVREEIRTLVLLPLFLGIALIATPLFNAAHADSTWARSAVLERLIELRQQGRPSSAEPRLLMALANRDQASIASAFHALSSTDTQKLVVLQESMGMDSQALNAKGFAEKADVDAAVDYSRNYGASKEVQQNLYGLLALTAPRQARE